MKKEIIFSLILIGLLFIAGCRYPASTTEAPQIIDNELSGAATTEVIQEVSERVIGDEPEPEEVEEDGPDDTVEVIEETASPEEEPKTTVSGSETPRKVVTEGDLVSFPNLKATDPDGDVITYTFTKPLDKEGEWQTETGDMGEYKVTITASDGINSVSQDVIVVVHRKNDAPTLDVPQNITVFEGETIALDPVTNDADGDHVTISYSGWVDDLPYKTQLGDEGLHAIKVTATDGIEEVTVTVYVEVVHRNRPPLLDEIDDLIIDEGELVVIDVVTADPDADDIVVTFPHPFTMDGTWQTEEGDEGVYTFTISASDGEDVATKTVKIFVNPINSRPVIEFIEDINVAEGETVKINVDAEDPDGDDVLVTFSGWMTSSVKETTFGDAGEYNVKVTASDGKKEASQIVAIVVGKVNRAPSFDPGAFV